MSHLFQNKKFIVSGILLILLIILITLRIYLNTWLQNYVNRTLNSIDGYQGSIQSIDIDLYRSAYRIHQLKIYKKASHIPSPFIAIDTIDLSIQWKALIHGRIVSNIALDSPVLNFAISKAGTEKQTGAGVDWNKPIKDLMPIDINKLTFQKGKLTYQDFSTSPRVNIYIQNISGEVHNLRNVEHKDDPLPSTLYIKGDSIGKGTLEMEGKLNILKEVPDMSLNTKLENVNLRALNDYSNAYAAIDIRGGNLSVYSEFKVKDGAVSGYIKPIARNISLIDLNKSTNPIKVGWEAVVAVVVEIFTNHSKDQFATKVLLNGRLDNVNTDTWSVIEGIIENAFIEAFKKGLDHNITPK